MIRVQFGAIGQNMVGKLIDLLDVSRKPGNGITATRMVSTDDLHVLGLLTQLVQRLLHRFLVLVLHLNEELVLVLESCGGSRFDLQQVDLILLENVQNLGQHTALLFRRKDHRNGRILRLVLHDVVARVLSFQMQTGHLVKQEI